MEHKEVVFWFVILIVAPTFVQSNSLRLGAADDREIRQIDYTRDCGQEVFNETEGEIRSPNYPDHYDNNLRCSYRIYFPKRSIKPVPLAVMLCDLQVEQCGGNGCACDRVNIDSSFPKDCSETQCSYSRAYLYPPPYIYQQPVYVSFQSDTTVTGRGFRLVYAFNKSEDYVRAMCGGECLQPAENSQEAGEHGGHNSDGDATNPDQIRLLPNFIDAENQFLDDLSDFEKEVLRLGALDDEK